MPPVRSSAEANLREDVEILAGVIGERNSRRPDGVEAARWYLRRRLAEMGQVATEFQYAVRTRTAVNLEVSLPGTSAEKKCVVVGAHYDTAFTTPGADDNASAVASLLQIIRALKDVKRRRTLRCVFYDCEEPPHFATPQMGSFQHAKALRAAGVEIHGMICLESIGYFPPRVDPAVDRPAFIRVFDWLIGGRYVAIVSDFNSIPFGLPFVLRFMTAGLFRFVPAALPRSVGIIDLSDHRSYWQYGYRALMVTNTAMFRNPNYHLPTDTPETLDYRRLARLTQLLTSVIRRTCA